MIVVIANSLPDRIRGRMKLWFIEPKPNVFVSGVTDHVADKVVSYLLDNCPLESGLLVFKSVGKTPYYKIFNLGEGEENFVGDSEIIALGGASNETKDRPLG